MWSLVSVSVADSAPFAAVQLADGKIVRLPGVPEGIALIDIFRNWEAYHSQLQSINPQAEAEIEGAQIRQPLRFPPKLLCIGANYSDHRKEMSAEGSGGRPNPFFFLKPPTTALIGPDEDILIRSTDDRVDWEGEIAIVIGKGGRFIKRDDALGHIAGVTLANDISARGAHHQPNAVHAAFSYDWFASKSQDGFCPIGPGIVPNWFVEDIDDIPFELLVNGNVEQSSTTAYTITDIRDQVVAASQLVTLEPGDVILTGTPAGVGAPRGLFLRDGDEVVVRSPVIGELRNRVRSLAD